MSTQAVADVVVDVVDEAGTAALAARVAAAVCGAVDVDPAFAALWPTPRTPLVLTLQGTLGAGKTTFVRSLVAALPGGVDVVVQSPTFALLRTYATTPAVHHMDLYRLVDVEGAARAARDLGLLDEIHGLAVVEWPIADIDWGVPVVEAVIDVDAGSARRFTFRPR
jgi:tRNA threonylcarbamoyl adenosine modification protein YjeE